MARLPRYILPGQPQHIIQRGNNRRVIFAADADYQFYRDAMVEAAGRRGLAIHAYVWMTNLFIRWRPLNSTTASEKFSSPWGGVMYSTSISLTGVPAQYRKDAIGRRQWIVNRTC